MIADERAMLDFFTSLLSIGFAIAERLGHEGAKVVISSRDVENVKKAVQRLISGGMAPANVCGYAKIFLLFKQICMKIISDFTKSIFRVFALQMGVNPVRPLAARSSSPFSGTQFVPIPPVRPHAVRPQQVELMLNDQPVIYSR
jgi:hypothetical protein